MTDPIRRQFEQYALEIEELHQELETAVNVGNFGLARTIATTIKEAEIVRDSLLCCLGAALAGSANRRSPAVRGKRLSPVH